MALLSGKGRVASVPPRPAVVTVVLSRGPRKELLVFVFIPVVTRDPRCLDSPGLAEGARAG